MKKIITLFSVILLFNTAMVYGQAGKLDSTFGVKGLVKKAYSSYGDYIKDMAIQSDGKTIIAGYTRLDTSGNNLSCFMARYKLNGSADSTFGTNGVMHLTIGASTITSIALQSDGKIVAIGNIHQFNFDYLGIYRFNTNGSLDTNFNHVGLDSIYGVIPGNVRIASSGNIYIGAQSATNYCVIKYLTDGTVDNSYAFSGYAYFPLAGSGIFATDTLIGSSQLITIQSDEKILYPLGASKDLGVIRFTTNGDLDSTFGTSGLTRTNLNGWGDFGNVCAVQSDGKIVVSGYSEDSAYKAIRLAVVRFNTNGSLDSAFGTHGKIRTNVLTFSQLPTPVAFQSDGKIVVAATSEDTATTYGTSYSMIRLNTDGSADTTFGKKGVDSTQLTPNCYMAAMQIAPSGKIEITGTARGVSKLLPPYAVTARYFNTAISTGVLDFAKKSNTMLVFPNPVHNNLTISYTLVNDETLSMVIYDIQGHVVKQVLNNAALYTGTHTASINMNELATGNYIVAMTNAAGEHITLKIVKD